MIKKQKSAYLYDEQAVLGNKKSLSITKGFYIM